MGVLQRLCPACGSSQGSLVANIPLRTPDGHPLQGGYNVACCDTCGTGLADVVLQTEFYNRYYEELAKYGSENAVLSSGVVDEPRWLRDKSDQCAQRILRATTGQPGRLVDIGCSTGSVLGALQRLGVESLAGIDPSPQSVLVACCRKGLDVRLGTFTDMAPDIGPFDCIVLTGVFEHLWDIDEAMQVILSLLSPEGIVYVEIPDASRYCDPYVAPFEDFNTEHVNHFSLTSLENLGRRYGLATISHERADSEIAPGVLVAGVAVAWRRSPSVQGIVDDDLLRRSLGVYGERSARDFEALDEDLDRKLGASQHFVLWGIGELAFRLLAGQALACREPEALVDGNPARFGLRFDGVNVQSVDVLERTTAPIVACSLVRATSIVSAARERHLSDRLVVTAWRVPNSR